MNYKNAEITAPAAPAALRGIPPPYTGDVPVWCAVCDGLPSCRVQWAKYFERHAHNCPLHRQRVEADRARYGEHARPTLPVSPELTVRKLRGVLYVHGAVDEPLTKSLARLEAAIRADGEFDDLSAASIWFAYRHHPELQMPEAANVEEAAK